MELLRNAAKSPQNSHRITTESQRNRNGIATESLWNILCFQIGGFFSKVGERRGLISQQVDAGYPGEKYSSMQLNTVQCSAIQSNAVQCRAIQSNAVQCRAMQSNAEQCRAMQSNAVQCRAMQSNAEQCNPGYGEDCNTKGQERMGIVSQQVDTGYPAFGRSLGTITQFDDLH
jgi:hypothetical protein